MVTGCNFLLSGGIPENCEIPVVPQKRLYVATVAARSSITAVQCVGCVPGSHWLWESPSRPTRDQSKCPHLLSVVS